MKRLLTHQDGRLKTGRLALLIFVLLLLVGALIFKAGSQMDTVLVEVQHVFEPQPPATVSEPEPESKPEPDLLSSTTVDEHPAPPSEVGPSFQQVAVEPVTEENSPAAMSPPVLVSPSPAQMSAVAPQSQQPALPDTVQLMTEKTNQTLMKVSNPHRELTLEPERYFELMQQWRSSGDAEEGKDSIPLQVDNLRDCYPLFQMKVIAVNVKGHMFDLVDGSRIAPESLGEYSSTVISVDQPWQQWGEVLKTINVKRGDPIQVRYYMYPFVKNAIYARSRQGFDWCKKSGLLSSDVQPNQVDVLGKTYTINRQGGGRFGVFVPVSLQLTDGTTIEIPIAAFAGQADIQALQQSGIL